MTGSCTSSASETLTTSHVRSVLPKAETVYTSPGPLTLLERRRPCKTALQHNIINNHATSHSALFYAHDESVPRPSWPSTRNLVEGVARSDALRSTCEGRRTLTICCLPPGNSNTCKKRVNRGIACIKLPRAVYPTRN